MTILMMILIEQNKQYMTFLKFLMNLDIILKLKNIHKMIEIKEPSQKNHPIVLSFFPMSNFPK